MNQPDTRSPEDPKVVRVYGDIEEEDNHLPNWWLFTLYATIVFSFVYWFVYHTAEIRPTPTAAYRSAVEELVAARVAANPASAEAILALSRDSDAVAAGADVFRTTCAACHGARGEGVIGPNLTDDHWIHPPDPESIYNGVMNGYVEKGMPAWGPMLGPERTLRVTAYVLTLKGTHVPGKAPQGDLVE